MANFFKSLFKGKNEEHSSEENSKDKSVSKNFEIFKYDGIRAQRMGRVDYAIKCYEKALELESDFEVMNYLSQIYAQIDEPEKACSLLEQMIEMEPQIVTTYLILANVLFQQTAYNEMISVLGKAVAVDEANADVHYMLGKGHKYQEVYDAALQYLTRAIELREDFIEAALMRAEILLQQKEYTGAMADVEKALQIKDDEEHALLLRGKLHKEMGHAQEAERDFREVTELNPFHDQAFICLVQLYIEQKKLKEAIALCDDAIELNPNSVALYHERANAKLANGDMEGAAEDGEIALQMTADSKEQGAKQSQQQEQKQENSLGLPFN